MHAVSQTSLLRKIGSLVLAACLMALLIASLAWAHDPDRPDQDRWYEGLSRHDGMTTYNCCNRQDCKPATYRMRAGGYEVYVDTKTFGPTAPNDWRVVPSESVLRQHDNPTGEGVACWHNDHLVCFIPSNET
jgi:hypothetical protein